ncbi:MAG: GGDEF domain-containing protein, partial [Desulfuromonadales bacterium]
IVGLSILTLVLLLGSSFLMLNHMSGKIDVVHRQLREVSITDELTGLRNRRYLMIRFSEELERSRRLGTSLSLLMMDLDHFKSVNDTCGHPFGDLVLKSVARCIADTFREYDIAGRYGGEEFAVVVSGLSHQDVVAMAERVREKIAALNIGDAYACIRVTVSIGVAVFGDSDTHETLLKRADAALYMAKTEGRNRTVLL